MFRKIRFRERRTDETALPEDVDQGDASSQLGQDGTHNDARESPPAEPDVGDIPTQDEVTDDIDASSGSERPSENSQPADSCCADSAGEVNDSRAEVDASDTPTGTADVFAGLDRGDRDAEPVGVELPWPLDDLDGSVATDLEIPVCDTAPRSSRKENVREIGRRGRRRSRAMAKAAAPAKKNLSGQQRLLLLDSWLRSGLPAGDFAPLVGISKHTLYKWKERFQQHGPAGLADQPRGRQRGSQLPDLTRRTILMLKQAHPEWGCQRISDMLTRGPALAASAAAVARVLHEAGYESVDVSTRPHPDHVRRFERARANELWQTDLFTFVLKRQNRRLHLVAFLDDFSRFVVSFGLHASASTALVLEALEAGIASYGPPREILTDNGPQYVTWRGKSQFARHLEKRGIRQIVARPRRPQTLGKIERFWGTLWREFLETAVFVDLADARTRIGLFVDYYNFQRVHRGIEGVVPADRFFGAASDVLRTLKERVAANALELARHGTPQRPFYVTGQVDGKSFSVHAEGQRLILRREDGQREEVTLSDVPPDHPSAPLPEPICPQGAPPVPAGEPAQAPPPAPGESALDRLIADQPEDHDAAQGHKQEEEQDDEGPEGGLS